MAQRSWIWKETAEIVGALGVIASLIFVALEIRQNTDAVRSATVQDISRWSYDASLVVLEIPELLAAREAACSGNLSQQQRIQLTVYYAALLRIQMNRYQQSQLGILDEDFALNLGGRGGAYANPFFPEAWSLMKNEFDPGFQEFVEREILVAPEEECLGNF